MTSTARRPATEADFWAIPEGVRFHEFIAGELIEKAAPSGEHGGAQFAIAGALGGPFQRVPGGRGPGGWWFASEVEVRLPSRELVRPDVLGWRRQRCPTRPLGTPIDALPDWICEIVSPGNATDDTIKKLRLYHRAQVPHYWLVDPRAGTLTVLRWSADGYVTILSAERGEVVRPQPFEAIELAVGTLLGDDDP